MEEPEPSATEADVEYVPGVAYPWVVAVIVVAALLGAGVATWIVRPDGDRAPSDVDRGFVIDMRTHHQQAIEMALLELGNGADPIVVGFAREILVRQNVELGLMAAELDDWGIPTDRRPSTAMAWMGDPVPYEEMPGLATQIQMDELRGARGTDADALFLALMAEHHRGGVDMASFAEEYAETEDVRQLASGIAAMQILEINEYRATVEQLGLDVEIPPYDAESAHH